MQAKYDLLLWLGICMASRDSGLDTFHTLQRASPEYSELKHTFQDRGHDKPASPTIPRPIPRKSRNGTQFYCYRNPLVHAYLFHTSNNLIDSWTKVISI